MSQRLGRKPLTTGHVDHLYGSARAKDRMRMFLETLRGEITVLAACEQLGLSEAQFHHARHVWMQESLEALEPRKLGRPPKQVDAAELARRCAALEAEVEKLRGQLRGAEVREEIASILPERACDPGKKTADDAVVPVRPR